MRRYFLIVLFIGLALFYIQPKSLPAPVSTPAPSWAMLNEKGLDLFNQGLYPEALVSFTRAVELRPQETIFRRNAAQARAKMGWDAIRNGNFAEAEDHFNRAIELFDQEGSFYIGKGLAQRRLKKDQEALESLLAGLQLNPDDPSGYKILGEIYYDQNDFEKAAAAWEKAAQLDPRDALLSARLEKIKREGELFSQFRKGETPHFNLLFEGGESAELARRVLRLLEDAYWEIGQALSYYPEKTIFAILYTDQQFRDVTKSPAWTKALFDGKIHLPVGGPIQDESLLKKIIGHEFTHALVHQLSNGKTPTWLNEGLALYFEEKERSGRPGALPSPADPFIPLSELHGSFMSYDEPTARRAYAESGSAAAYLIDRGGFFRVKLLLEKLASGASFSAAFEDIYLISYGGFQEEWRKKLQMGSHSE